MSETTLKKFYTIMFLLVLIVGVWGFRTIQNSGTQAPILANDFSVYESQVIWRDVEYGTMTASLNNQEVTLAIAADQPRRRLGLSGVEELPQDYGMIFVFPEERPHGFWMKQMNFPIDIAWLNSDKKIVKIMNNVAPETFPTTFGAEVDSRYVIEVNAGFFETYGVEFGQEVEFELPFE